MKRPPRWAWRGIVRVIKAALLLARVEFDLHDVFFFGGLAIAGYGGAMLSLPWTLVVIGAVIALKGNGPLIDRREAK